MKERRSNGFYHLAGSDALDVCAWSGASDSQSGIESRARVCVIEHRAV